MRCLTDEEIRHLVGRVVSTPGLSLNSAIEMALFGKIGAPRIWGDWPDEARTSFDRACEIYRIERRRILEDRCEACGDSKLTLEVSWEVIFHVAQDKQRWWLLPGVTWRTIGEHVGLPPRGAAYRMKLLGWKMKGAGMNVPGRAVIYAPCVSCGTVWRPKEIHERLGECCRPE